jgi:putative MATE family efflux protein
MSKPVAKKTTDLLHDPVPFILRKMTVPMIYGMILLMSFNLIDTFFVSLLGTKPLAAISFTFPITFTIISLMIGLGIGTSAVIAKYLGAKQLDEARDASMVALLLGAIIVVTVSTLGYFYADPLFHLIGAKPYLLPLIHQYMDTWFLGSIGLIGPMIGNAILRSSGDTKTPSIVMGTAGLINAMLDPLLIFGYGPFPELGLQGAAIATLVSWLVGLTIIIYVLAVQKRLITLTLPSWLLFSTMTKRILHIGLPAAGANMLTPIAASVMTAMIAKYGEAAVAGFGVGSRIESIASIVVLALSMTLPPFISQNFGAGQMVRVLSGYKTSIKFVLFWQLLIYGVLLLLADVIAGAFAKEQAVADVIKLFIWILPLGYGLQGVIILTNSSFNALHKPLTALVLSIIRLFVCYVPLAYLGSLYYGVIGFFVGALFANLIMANISYLTFTRLFQQHDCSSSKNLQQDKQSS